MTKTLCIIDSENYLEHIQKIQKSIIENTRTIDEIISPQNPQNPSSDTLARE